MNRSTTATRVRRLATLIGAASALAVLAPAVAHADAIGWGGTLKPNQSQCVTRYADTSVYQVRAEGSATGSGARFRFLRNGVVLNATPVDTATAFAAERRTAYGNYPGAGYYQICAANHHPTNTLVNIRVLFNSEFV